MANFANQHDVYDVRVSTFCLLNLIYMPSEVLYSFILPTYRPLGMSSARELYYILPKYD